MILGPFRTALPVSLMMAVLVGAALAQPTSGFDPDGDGSPGGPLVENHLDDAALVVLSRTDDYCYFGLYRTTQMSLTAWKLFDIVVAHYLPPGPNARILQFSYNSDVVPPVDYLQRDSFAVYQRLQVLGYQVTNRPQYDMPELDREYYKQFDLVVYWNSFYGYDPSVAVAAGVPIITNCAVVHPEALGLGISVFDQREADSVCVVETYGPLASHPLGEMDLQGPPMWMHAIPAAEGTLTLLRYDCPFVATESTSWGTVKARFR